MPKLRAAIIGCGKVSHLHARALTGCAEAEFRAVFSRSAEKAAAFARHYGVRPYSDLDAMLEKERPDMVLVCTPHPFHAEPTLRAARAGAHVLVEKPLASSLADCDAMINACGSAGVRLGTISQRRWYAPVQRMSRAIAEGKIGKPVLCTVTILGWRDQAYYKSDPWRGSWKEEGGGVLVNQAPHQMDILQWLMGPVAEITGYWANLNHPYIEVEDTAVAIIRFARGALGSIIVSNSQKPGIYGKVHVHGANGSSVGVQTDGGAMFVAGMSTIAEPPVNDLWTIPGEEGLLSEWKKEDEAFFKTIDPTTYYHGLQIADFLHSISTGRQPAVTGEEGRKTVELFTGIYRSQRDGKPVRFPLVPEKDRTDLDGRLSGASTVLA
ncbi:MAG: Gfo/Idh/MocA family oxidoreductase [Spirochaetia bacterium]